MSLPDFLLHASSKVKRAREAESLGTRLAIVIPTPNITTLPLSHLLPTSSTPSPSKGFSEWLYTYAKSVWTGHYTPLSPPPTVSPNGYFSTNLFSFQLLRNGAWSGDELVDGRSQNREGCVMDDKQSHDDGPVLVRNTLIPVSLP